MNKQILKNPEYLNVTYSNSKAPPSKYPSIFSQFLFKKYFSNKGKILDLGCGNADYVREFSNLGFKSYGLDISPNVLQNTDLENVKLADLENGENPFSEEQFDHIFSKSVIEHMNNPMSLLKISYDCLKQGGTAVILTPSWRHNWKEAFYIDHTHVTPFTKPSLSDALKMAGFKDVEVYYFYQLPLLWKYPFLKVFSKILALLPFPYAPLRNVPWSVSNKFNKYVRFSKEVMLLAVAKK